MCKIRFLFFWGNNMCEQTNNMCTRPYSRFNINYLFEYQILTTKYLKISYQFIISFVEFVFYITQLISKYIN